jgi:polysaccharide deacetylase 2 family uncharacterized protein YibQ
VAADDLSAPLGQDKKPRRTFPVTIPQVIVGGLALFATTFLLWAAIADNPLGGEPMAVVRADLKSVADAQTKKIQVVRPHTPDDGGTPDRYDGPAHTPGSTPQGPPPGSKTVNIIDGKSGTSQVVVLPGPADGKTATGLTPFEQNFAETSKHGLIPRIAEDGVHPSEAFAQAVKPLPGKPDAPRVAIIVGGLGVSASATAEALGRLPGAVTLAFTPYGADLERLAARARGLGHEILLQVPMEPFDYPDNDPGPQTLLTSLTPDQNIDRLHWLMSRFRGYVGIANSMGARFTASEQAFAPVLRETAKRGLIFVDDGEARRSLAGQIAGANKLPFAKADFVLDAVPTPAEIDRALSRLEMAARERGVAVGFASALPVAIDHIAKWSKTAQSRGLLLVPITAVAVKSKQS